MLGKLRHEAAKLRPGSAQEYLRSRGWRLHDDLSAQHGVVVYEREDHSVEVPTRPEYADYGRRMLEIVELLSEIEGLDALALLEEIARPPGDLIAIRVASDSASSGTIPLLDSIRLREGAKNSLLAAAHSALVPQAYFPRMSRSEAVTLLAGVREAQTERGSFVSRIIVPTEPTVGQLDFEDPYGRVVVRRLLVALDAIRHVRSLGAYEDLLTKSADGVSANLLSALASMKPTGDSAQLEWSVRWSRNRQAPTHAVSQVRFSAEALDGLHAAAEAMRSQSQSIGYEVVGYVAKLSRAAGHSPGPGEVVVVPTGADATELGRVAVRLEPADYDRAIQAHQAGRLIRLVGTLKKASRRWGLEGVVAVETLPDDGADA